MIFLKNIAFPLLIAAIAVSILSTVINFLLRLIGLDITFIKLILFFAVWYFIGPILYDFVLTVMSSSNEIIEFIYMPVQTIMGIFNI